MCAPFLTCLPPRGLKGNPVVSAGWKVGWAFCSATLLGSLFGLRFPPMLLAPRGQMTVPERPERGLPGASETPSPRPTGLAIECRTRPQEEGGTRRWLALPRNAGSHELSVALGGGAGAEALADLLGLWRQMIGVQQPNREDKIFKINNKGV